MTIKSLCGDEDCLLLERIQRGDKLAIALLYDRHSSAVYSVALRLLKCPAQAERVLSDIFMEIWRNPGRIMHAESSVTTLLVLVSRNRAIAMRRQEALLDIDFGFANHLESDMTHEKASAAIEALSADRRVTLQRIFFDESPQ